MRTELKIGVTVVLVVSVMVLVYFVFFANRGETPPQPKQLSVRESNHSAPAPSRATPGRGRSTTPPGPLAATPPGPRTPTTGPVATRPAPETIAETDVRPPRPPADSTVISRTEPPLPPVGLPPARTEPPARPEPSGFTPTPIFPAGGRIETITPPAPVDDRSALSPVRPGTVEANAARRAAAGTLVRKADGKDYYTVQDGDKGYWGIAARPGVYGDGRKWDLIQKANPGAEPSRLRVGQELVIPPLPAGAGATTRPVPIALTPSTRPAGSSMYTVKQGDSLATIAKARYGTEAVWHEIAKANPSADPAHLRIGQELVLPSAEDVRRAAGLPAVSTTAPASPTSRPALARTTPTPPVRTTSTPPVRTTTGWD